MSKPLPFGTGYIKRFYRDYRRAALKRNLDFSLSLQQFTKLIVTSCFYCGSPPRMRNKIVAHVRGQLPVNGVDRVNSTLGYSLHNCVACCKKCNMMKGTISLGDFLEKVGCIYEKFEHYYKSQRRIMEAQNKEESE